MTRSTTRRSLAALAALLLLSPPGSFSPPPAAADIYRWDNGELITEKDAEPGADLSDMQLGYADLVGAQLCDAGFQYSDLTSAHLMHADLTGRQAPIGSFVPSSVTEDRFRRSVEIMRTYGGNLPAADARLAADMPHSFFRYASTGQSGGPPHE